MIDSLKNVNKNIAMYFSGRVFSSDFDNFLKRLKRFPYFKNIIFFVSLNQSKEKTETDGFFKKFRDELDIRSPDQFNIEETPVELSQELKDAINPFKNNIPNICSMYYHNKRCFDLIEKFCVKYNHKFDVVIRFRSDININSDLDLHEIEKNTVYVPNCRWKETDTSIDDCIAFGDFDTMKKYSNVYDNILYYCLHENASIHPETIIKYHLVKNNIQIKHTPFKYNLSQTRHKKDYSLHIFIFLLISILLTFVCITLLVSFLYKSKKTIAPIVFSLLLVSIVTQLISTLTFIKLKDKRSESFKKFKIKSLRSVQAIQITNICIQFIAALLVLTLLKNDNEFVTFSIVFLLFVLLLLYFIAVCCNFKMISCY
jgi:hypothetical protein